MGSAGGWGEAQGRPASAGPRVVSDVRRQLRAFWVAETEGTRTRRWRGTAGRGPGSTKVVRAPGP